MNIDKLREDNNGQLPAFAWPGGYPIYYLAKDNGVLCPKCANDFKPERDTEEQLKPVAWDVYWEGPVMQCEHCGVEIESAYGDPDADAEAEDADIA